MALFVVHPGLSTTVQDRGRTGFRAWGMPVGGCFDRSSFDLANALVGNRDDAATLEMTLVGGEYRAETSLSLALAGAPMGARIRRPSGVEFALAIPQSFTLRAGDRIEIGGTPVGARTYLAVRGGWQTPVVLGSRSGEARLAPGDRLPAFAAATLARRPSAWPWEIGQGTAREIRFVDGPDARPDANPGGGWERSSFVVSSRSDRMGVRFDGPRLDVPTARDRPSMPVAPGAIQVAGGAPLVLGVAGGTMGGYPHIGHVISPDLDRLAQLRPGGIVRFQRVSIEEARNLDRDHRASRSRWADRVAVLSGSPPGRGESRTSSTEIDFDADQQPSSGPGAT